MPKIKFPVNVSTLSFFASIFLAYAQKIGFTGQFLIEPKPKEPTKHQYDYGNSTNNQIKLPYSF